MIGIDIVDLSRINLTDSFIRFILTDSEQAEFENRKTDKRRIEYLGGRFAAKEAIFKATHDKNYLKYSVLNDTDGTPYIKDHPEISISITHDGGIAAAIVMIAN